MMGSISHNPLVNTLMMEWLYLVVRSKFTYVRLNASEMNQVSSFKYVKSISKTM